MRSDLEVLKLRLYVAGRIKHNECHFETGAEGFSADGNALVLLSEAVRVTLRAEWKYGQQAAVLGDWPGAAHPIGSRGPTEAEAEEITEAIRTANRLAELPDFEIGTLELEDFLGNGRARGMTAYREYADTVLTERANAKAEAALVEHTGGEAEGDED